MPQEPELRAARDRLDEVVVNIELTLISIIQGLALAVLAGAAVQPILRLQWQAWPYIFAGLLVVLIFWSRALVHTLSFIRWPLEFGHTFAYFGATLVEAVALTQVAEPAHWFALYALAVWGLYAWDLRVVLRDARPVRDDSERALQDDIVRDQRLNIRFMMPAAVAFQALSWWLVQRYPQAMLGRGGHLVLIGLTLAFSIHYLHGGVRLLRRRQHWLLSRAAD
ncbi:MAG: hypothetical protein QM719_09105 [Thermomonas sp.]